MYSCTYNFWTVDARFFPSLLSLIKHFACTADCCWALLWIKIYTLPGLSRFSTIKKNYLQKLTFEKYFLWSLKNALHHDTYNPYELVEWKLETEKGKRKFTPKSFRYTCDVWCVYCCVCWLLAVSLIKSTCGSCCYSCRIEMRGA